MEITDLVVEVRNAALERVGQITPDYLSGFTAVLRNKAIGSWSISLPDGNRIAELLTEPGAGIVVTTSEGTLLSGPTRSVTLTQSTEDSEGTYEITGVDDSVILDERLAYPKPSTADVTAQNVAYDIRTGVAETVMKAYVNANIGPSAPAARKIANLLIETDLARGTNVNGQARFDKLQELLVGLADVGGVSFNVEQIGDNLVFQVWTPEDRSGYIRLDLQNGRLTQSDYSYSQPLATRVIVGGKGDNEFRLFAEHSNATSLSAETQWGRRIETFVDARGTDVPAEIAAAANEILVKDGKTQVNASVSPSDDQTMLYGKDWNLGDLITVVIGDFELVAVVAEVGIQVSPDGVRLGVTVGEPRSLDYETQILTRQANAAVRIGKLERTK